ncbi:MAG: polyprenyl synthetase family protein [Alphaproteobacteria bacterium]|nr:polyprenyl synthetase family protein [Alphaproteobacteria bacterium]
MQSIHALGNILSVQMNAVHGAIIHTLKSDVPLIETLGGHVLKAGGKRLRPLLTLASANLFSTHTSDALISLASAVELIHTATLIHDDVLDDSHLRRGTQTAKSLWGNTCSILVGDFLFARAFEKMVDCQNLDILTYLSQISGLICQGEVKQLTMQHDISAQISDYLDVISLKTASLFRASCYVGAKIVGAPEESAHLIGQYGENLGMAFQIVDDILDYTQTAETLGKEPGDDYQEGKMTLPIILLLQAQPDLAPIFVEDDKKHFDVLLQAMKAENIIDACHQYARHYANQALACLESIHTPTQDYNQNINADVHIILRDLAQEALHRHA